MPMYSEYAGLTAEVAGLIELHRHNPQETKCEILQRALSPASKALEPKTGIFNLGQGAGLHVGEPLFLFLSKPSMINNKPDAIAEVKTDGIYLDGKKVKPSKGSSIHPAMKIVQEKLGHRNEKGRIISLSAWRQWHVLRNGKLTRLLDLKNPKLARTRGKYKFFTLADLGLE